ncbi:hypothetical protein [Streptomyces sp. NBC_01236]|uniref:hypothetical protein n=1 Tax=Streptomyces sp. NBC_01236 TaxID=2903789 RepID=UPI002E12FD18|nr:hypothetical protein OG324_49400 [Streptomyces sp. NBC_01236]
MAQRAAPGQLNRSALAMSGLTLADRPPRRTVLRGGGLPAGGAAVSPGAASLTCSSSAPTRPGRLRLRDNTRPARSDSVTAAVMTSSGVWKTSSPMAGVFTQLFSENVLVDRSDAKHPAGAPHVA